jgi:hypothetical protein
MPSPASTTPTTASPTPEPSPAQPASAPSPEPSPTPEQSPTPAPEQGSSRKSEAGGACVLTASETTLSLKSNGGSAIVALGLENYTGRPSPHIDPSTANWADIIVLAEPRAPSDGNGARFTITSVSAKTGAFNVTFSSPCGKQQVAVNVR